MWHKVCRHYSVQWLGSHHCHCNDCGKHGHWFEEGFALWTMCEQVPEDIEEPQSAFANFPRAKQAG